jgi:gamma-glutamylputrescine oxidase
VSAFILPKDMYGFPAATYSAVVVETCRPEFQAPERLANDARDTIVIVGGGYTGLSTALHLAQLSNLRIIVLDEKKLGTGPSGHSGGHLGGLQASDEEAKEFCGEVLGDKLIEEANKGPDLVRSLIQEHGIDCDLRDGYINIDGDGNQELGEGFQIEPYTYLLGLAEAAHKLGVEIYENVRVSGIVDNINGCSVSTSHGTIRANYVVAAGGHRMGETIESFVHHRDKTAELYLTTIKTAPLPPSVRDAIMPEANGRRLPYCDDTGAVGYGGIERSGALTFGTGALGWRATQNKERIKGRLRKIFPELEAVYEKATGEKLSYEYDVKAMPGHFTKALLPCVGEEGTHGRTLSAYGLCGQGIGVAAVLGAAMAREIHRRCLGKTEPDEVFAAFAAVPHKSIEFLGIKPLRNKYFRMAAAEIYELWWERDDYIARAIKFLRNPRSALHLAQ